MFITALAFDFHRASRLTTTPIDSAPRTPAVINWHFLLKFTAKVIGTNVPLARNSLLGDFKNSRSFVLRPPRETLAVLDTTLNVFPFCSQMFAIPLNTFCPCSPRFVFVLKVFRFCFRQTHFNTAQSGVTESIYGIKTYCRRFPWNI